MAVRNTFQNQLQIGILDIKGVSFKSTRRQMFGSDLPTGKLTRKMDLSYGDDSPSLLTLDVYIAAVPLNS
jgi:hypothetical protein